MARGLPSCSLPRLRAIGDLPAVAKDSHPDRGPVSLPGDESCSCILLWLIPLVRGDLGAMCTA